MFAVNFEIRDTFKCTYTGMELEVTEDFFRKIESELAKGYDGGPPAFRQYVLKEYTSNTLSYEMGVENKKVRDATLFKLLMDKYQYRLKEDVLTPFLENDNFRNAIRDYGTPSFNTYDKKITRDVKFLIKNLIKKYWYTEEGAKQICIYVVDNIIP